MRRAASLLFVIESRTAHLMDRSRRKMELFVTEQNSEARELAFLEAFGAGREPPLRPTIQHLEFFAPQWAALVPSNPSVRAAVAHLFGEKYAFTRDAAPRIRAALGLDEELVQAAYLRQCGESLEDLFRAHLSISEWLSWTWATLMHRLESLTPFWTVFGVTVAFSLSQAFLALPTGLAGVGLSTGVAMVLVVGFINVLTMACMAETCARNGDVHYGKGFLGALVAEYLGNEGSYLYSVATFIRTFLVALAGSLGLGITFAAFTEVPATVWIVALFGIEIFYLSRKFGTTINTMLLLTAVNLVLLVPIIGLAFAHADPANLAASGGFFGEVGFFAPSALQFVLGVTIMLYIGHVGVIQCARLVLPRDPSGRSLIQGSIAGTCFLTVVFIVWLVAVNSAVSQQQLTEEAGTALAPLAENIGFGVRALGILVVALLLGVSCLKVSDILFKLVAERIPSRVKIAVVLPRRRGRMLLRPRGKTGRGNAVGLTYRGLTDGKPRFLAEVQQQASLYRYEFTVERHCDTGDLRGHMPKGSLAGAHLAFEIIDAIPQSVHMRVETSMRLTYDGEWEISGRGVTDILELSEPLRVTLNWLMRRERASAAEIAAHTGQGESDVSTMLRELQDSGFVHVTQRNDEPRYRATLGARRRGRAIGDTWRALDQDEPQSAKRVRRPNAISVTALWARTLLSSDLGRFIQAASPILCVLVAAEWLLLTDKSSFAGVLGYAGVITNTLTAGIFPALLLLASRRKPDIVPGMSYRILGHPLFTATICTLFLLILALHAFIIWEAPLARGAALVFGLSTIAVIVSMLRHHAFARRVMIELRSDFSDPNGAAFTVTSGGDPLVADVRLGFGNEQEKRLRVSSGAVSKLSNLRYAAFEFPTRSARELKVWVHKTTAEVSSEPLSASLEVVCCDETQQIDLGLCEGRVVLPLDAETCSLKITLHRRGSD